MINENAQQMISANAAGEVLGVSGKTIIRMMENGDFPGYKIGSAWKFKRGDIEKYLESRKFERNKSKYKPNDAVKFLDMKAFADTAEEVWIHGHVASVLDEFENGSRLYSVYSETNDEFYDVPEDQLHML